jgi:hypothetical protein
MIVAALLLLAAAPAARDPAAGLVPTWEQSYYAEGSMPNRALRAVGYCAAEGRPDGVRALLRTLPGSTAEADAVRDVGLDTYTCLVAGLKMTIRSTPLYRGTLAEFLYKRQLRSLRRKQPLPAVAAESPLGRWGAAPGEGDIPVARRTAACVVEHAPDRAEALLDFDSGAIGETRVLKEMRPEMLSCLRPGEALRVSRLTMRALIAEALYQASETYRELFKNA